MSEIDRDRTVGALREVWARLDELCADLTAEQWTAPSTLPGWSVRETFVHVFGTEAMLLGRQPTAKVDGEAIEHVKNPIGEVNESWVATYADASTDELLAEFRNLTSERSNKLQEISDDDWDALGPSPVGKAPYGRFMQIRVFDCWMHEQDIRQAIGRPGGESGLAVEVSLDEMTTAMGFVVGKKAGAPAGASVTFDLTGDAARQIHVEVGERAAVADALEGPATATLTMSVLAFARIAGGRTDADRHRSHVSISGDADLGTRVLDRLAYTI